LTALGRILTVAAAIAVLAPAQDGAAQGAGTIRGVARDTSGQALALVYVMALARPDSRLTPLAYTLTDSLGRYTLTGLPPGEVFLRVRRIGWRISAAIPARVVADSTVEVPIRIAPVPVQLEDFRVVGSADCRRVRDVPANSPIYELWTLATDAVRARLAVSRSYAYDLHTVVELREGADEENWRIEVDSLARLRPSPTDLERRLNDAPSNRLFGYYRRDVADWRLSVLQLWAPGDGILLADAFTDRYCVVMKIDRSADDRAVLRFRPYRRDRINVTANVAIHFDRATGRMSLVEYEYEYRGERAGSGSVRYRNVSIDGQPLAWAGYAELIVREASTGSTVGHRIFRYTPSAFVRAVD
jgi:hypothetical protein